MTKTNVRRGMAVLLALAALGAAADLGAAQAARAANPFAGTYSGDVPGGSSLGWPSITISNRGQVSGSYYYGPWCFGPGNCYDAAEGRLSGSVTEDGMMSIEVSERVGHQAWVRYTLRARLSFGAFGSLIGVTEDGTTFTWSAR